jgi:hypothetical protein
LRPLSPYCLTGKQFWCSAYCCLVSKCVNSLVSSTAASLMSPLQVGVSVLNGEEAIVHRVNDLVKTFGTDDAYKGHGENRLS